MVILSPIIRRFIPIIDIVRGVWSFGIINLNSVMNQFNLTSYSPHNHTGNEI